MLSNKDRKIPLEENSGAKILQQKFHISYKSYINGFAKN